MSQGKSGVDADLPQLDFTTFVLSLKESADVHLGDGPHGEAELDLELAAGDIGILSLLQDKTKGNLTGDEERLLHNALEESLHRFEEVSKG